MSPFEITHFSQLASFEHFFFLTLNTFQNFKEKFDYKTKFDIYLVMAGKGRFTVLSAEDLGDGVNLSSKEALIHRCSLKKVFWNYFVKHYKKRLNRTRYRTFCKKHNSAFGIMCASRTPSGQLTVIVVKQRSQRKICSQVGDATD